MDRLRTAHRKNGSAANARRETARPSNCCMSQRTSLWSCADEAVTAGQGNVSTRGIWRIRNRRCTRVRMGYGDYEGRTTAEIQKMRRAWSLWSDGVPNGETIVQVAARALNVIDRVLTDSGDVLLFLPPAGWVWHRRLAGYSHWVPRPSAPWDSSNKPP